MRHSYLPAPGKARAKNFILMEQLVLQESKQV